MLHKKFQILLIIVLIAQEVLSAPASGNQRSSHHNGFNCGECKSKLSSSKNAKHRNNKKDVFVSRGWGAGGMPFTVLYMNQAYSSKAPATVNPTLKALPPLSQDDKQQGAHKNLRHITQTHIPKTAKQAVATNSHNSRLSHSVIPQLFVSYGWGPHGK